MGNIRVGKIAGIEINIHWSWFAIFTLLTWWLAEGFFKQVSAYDGWSTQERWMAAVVTTILFFVSVLLHELSHSIVARRLGLPVEGITLFIFGGVSSLGAEPESAKHEFAIAIVGPLTSFALGGFFAVLAGIGFLYDVSSSPPAAIVGYLAFINVAVGIFNMLPGFPLDGGRVLRAGLWARTGNMLKATKWASTAGTGISFVLIALGVMSVLIGNFIGGIWFIVIGWFLRNTSEASYQQLVFRQTLEGTKVRDMLSANFRPVPPDMTLNELVTQYMLGFSLRCVPVVVADDLLGIVTISDLKRVPSEEWGSTSAFRAMTPREKLHVIEPDDDLTRALEIMAQHDIHQLPVLDGRSFLGFVTRADVLRLIQVRTELKSANASA